MPHDLLTLGPHETALIGRWLQTSHGTEGDDTSRRIETLAADHLERVGAEPTGWDTLYRDPRDGRLWEKTYPQSDLHGGGPPTLQCVTPEYAARKYGPQAASNNRIERPRER